MPHFWNEENNWQYINNIIYKLFWMASWNSLIKLTSDSVSMSCDLKDMVNLVEDYSSAILVEEILPLSKSAVWLTWQSSLDKGQLRMGTCREK